VKAALACHSSTSSGSSLGRFTQADTIIPQSTQGVQAWDHYAYVNNNSLRYTDSTGHHCDEDLNGYCLNSTTTTSSNWFQELWQSIQNLFTPSITTGPGPVFIPQQQAPQVIPYWQNATATPQPPTATPQLSVQITAQSTVQATTTLTATPTKTVPSVLYHYTSFEGLVGITASQTLLPSLGTGPNAYFGEGIYFTDIPPSEAAATSPYKLSRALTTSPWRNNYMMAFVAVDVSGLAVQWESPVYSNTYGPASIYRYPSIAPLDISSRLVLSGPVPYINQNP
jgi:hypothetical protein